MARGPEFGADLTGAFAAIGSMKGVADEIMTGAYVSSAVKYTHAVLADAFDTDMDKAAQGAPDAYKHVYEWNQVGVPPGRLWIHRLRGRGRNRTATYEFLPSKFPVPVHKDLINDGPKTVKEGVHIFVWKAAIMEYGMAVTIRPKFSKFLVFPVPPEDLTKMRTGARERAEEKGMVFAKGPVTNVPGERVQGNFTSFFAAWWSGAGQSIFDNKVRAQLENDLKGVEFEGYIVGKRRNKAFSISTPGAGVSNNSRAFQRARRDAEEFVRSKAGKYDKAAARRRRVLYGA